MRWRDRWGTHGACRGSGRGTQSSPSPPSQDLLLGTSAPLTHSLDEREERDRIWRWKCHPPREKNLGVTLDNTLSFSANVKAVTLFCRFMLYNIRRVRPFLPMPATFRPHPTSIVSVKFKALPESLKSLAAPFCPSLAPCTQLTLNTVLFMMVWVSTAARGWFYLGSEQKQHYYFLIIIY